MVTKGIINHSEADKVRQVARESEERNLGYAFVTFSHSDEARLYVMRHTNAYMQTQKVMVDLKVNVNHADLDYDFYGARMHNNKHLVTELSALREAKQELRDFEATLDEEMPSRKKLKSFRNLAKDVIENNKGYTR